MSEVSNSRLFQKVSGCFYNLSKVQNCSAIMWKFMATTPIAYALEAWRLENGPFLWECHSVFVNALL